MLNIAVIVNTLAVLLGSVLGTFIGNKLPENIRKILFFSRWINYFDNWS